MVVVAGGCFSMIDTGATLAATMCNFIHADSPSRTLRDNVASDERLAAGLQVLQSGVLSGCWGLLLWRAAGPFPGSSLLSVILDYPGVDAPGHDGRLCMRNTITGIT